MRITGKKHLQITAKKYLTKAFICVNLIKLNELRASKGDVAKW